MSTQIIYRGNSAEINFAAKDSNGDPIDLTAMTDIRACIGSVILDIAGTGTQVVGDPVLGKWKAVLSVAETSGLALGRDKLEGQVEFGTSVDPIEFSASVLVKDKPC